MTQTVQSLRAKYAAIRERTMESDRWHGTQADFNQSAERAARRWVVGDGPIDPADWVEAAEIVLGAVVKNICPGCRTTRCPDGCCCGC